MIGVDTNIIVRLSLVLRLYEKGLDFADAMHLVATCRLDTFITFDKRCIKGAKGLTECRVKAP